MWSSLFNVFNFSNFVFVVENYGLFKSEVFDSIDGFEVDRIIIINKL